MRVQYDDGEDMIAISSEAEFHEGLALHTASNAGSLWKLLCRFDETPMVLLSGIHSPALTMSGMSTPSSVRQSEEPLASSAALKVKSPIEEDMVDLGTASSSVDLQQVGQAPVEVEVEFGRQSQDLSDSDEREPTSDDEYERIEVEPVQTPTATATASAVAAEPAVVAEAPAKVEVEAKVEVAAPVVVETVAPPTPLAASVVLVVDPLDSFVDQRGPERFGCKICTKLFRGKNFLVEHIKSRHPEVLTQPAEPTGASAPVVEAVAEATALPTSPVAPSKVEEEEASPKAGTSSVEITDVTGHHQHVDQTPSPEPPAAVAEATTASTPSSTSAAPAVVHVGVTCDGCGASPITGVRFHCTACLTPGGYDLCDSCESRGVDVHPATHVLLKMRTPAHVPVGTAQRHLHCPARGGRARGDAAGPRPKAQFISDMTLADGLQVHAGETLTKVWSIKNTGPEAWPIGTRIVFAGGDLAPESDNRTDAFGAAVPFAGPNDIVHVSVAIQVPNETGRFRGTFRLETPHHVRFGPRVWLDLVVPEESADPTVQSESEAVAADAPKVDSAAAEVLTPDPVGEQVAPQVDSPPASAASSPTPSVAVVSAESKQREEEDLSSAFAESHDVAVAAESLRFPAFQYPNQLVTLCGMGFKDAELNRYLLLNNQGDLQKVVAWLLNNAN